MCHLLYFLKTIYWSNEAFFDDLSKQELKGISAITNNHYRTPVHILLCAYACDSPGAEISLQQSVEI